MSRRVVLYLCASGASPEAVTAREVDLRTAAALMDYEAVAFHCDAPEAGHEPARPALAKAVDLVRSGGADVLVAAGPSGMVMNATSPAAVRDVVRQFAPFGL